MTSNALDSPAITRSIHLQIGLLDCISVSQLRQTLSDCPTGPGVHLHVDLSNADAEHDMTLFALLAEKARAMRATGGVLGAQRPSPRLGHLLTAIGVGVSTHPAPQTTDSQYLVVGKARFNRADHRTADAAGSAA